MNGRLASRPSPLFIAYGHLIVIYQVVEANFECIKCQIAVEPCCSSTIATIKVTITEVEMQVLQLNCPGRIDEIFNTRAESPSGKRTAIFEKTIKRIGYLYIAAE